MHRIAQVISTRKVATKHVCTSIADGVPLVLQAQNGSS